MEGCNSVLQIRGDNRDKFRQDGSNEGSQYMFSSKNRF